MNTPFAHAADSTASPAVPLGPSLVYLIDDDPVVRAGLSMLLRSRRLLSEEHDSAASFEQMQKEAGASPAHWPHTPTCLVLDVRMPAMSGLTLFERLLEQGYRETLPVIFLTGHGDVTTAVDAVQRGAFDFVEKPFSNNGLIDRVERALASSAGAIRRRIMREDSLRRVEDLTARERLVMWRVADGHPNKRIAQELAISVRTVEGHRARLFDKLKVSTPFALNQLLQLCRLNAPQANNPPGEGSPPT